MTKVGASVGAGAPPDLMAVDLIYVPQFAASNQLTDITEQAKALSYFDKLSPSHVRLATYEDKIFGVPFNAEGSYLIYNKESLHEGRSRPGESAQDVGRNCRRRSQDHGAGRRHLRLLLLGCMPGLQRLHLPASDVGERRRRDQR